MRAILFAVVCAFAVSEPAVHPTTTSGARADGRAGTVADLQGQAFVRPLGRTRASAIGTQSVVIPGDVLYTAARGAHVVAIALGDGDDGRVILGPGTQVVFTETGLELVRGDLAVEPAGTPIQVGLPGAEPTPRAEATVLRSADGRIDALGAAPGWLRTWREATSGGRVGSLIAQVDGRDVTLGVQSHVVDATIRDQIAETVVEQVFRNDTDQKLEGTFRFPLPDGASISGFDVWIGGRPVAADIVEKTRARQIYEELKKRKEDPALLEWTGANLFTARIWPIPAKGTKRIRIRYTEVLPLHGDTYRYRTALASELLQAQNVDTLRVRVAVQSTATLADVSSPTHTVVLDRREHTARSELNLDGTTPSRDFEFAVKLSERRPLTVVDHRRGDAGWFLALVTPPGDDATGDGWSRDLVPDGDPLDLLLVVDTSGSMHGDVRERQLAIVDALLAQLGENDRVRIATTDREVIFDTAESRPVNDAVRAACRQFVEAREPLGWSDPVGTMRTVLDAAGSADHVVYVGDGVPSADLVDPGDVAREVRALDRDGGPRCHAIEVSTSSERSVLDAMTRIGGGVRVDGMGPAGRVTRDLLTRIAQPAWRDLRIRIEGASYARVLPDPLPTLPVGAQQLVVGRYLPQDEPIRATLVAAGELDGEPVSVSREVTLGAGAGNDFLPRLWAVRHCDALIESGLNAAVRDEVVALSSEYGFMTPLTSMLVVDDPEERERYGLERRVRLRDGQRFFADAREAAADDVITDARRWRAMARAAALQRIRDLGRSVVEEAHPETKAILLERQRSVSTRTATLAENFFMGAGLRFDRSGAPPPSGGLEVLESAFDSNAWNSAVGLGGGAGGAFSGRERTGELFDDFGLAAEAIDQESARGYFGQLAGPSGPATPGLAAPSRRARGRSGFALDGLTRMQPGQSGLDPLMELGFPPIPEPAPIDLPAIAGLAPSEAWDLLRSLDRRDALTRMTGAVVFQLRESWFGGIEVREVQRRDTELMWSVGTWTRRHVADVGALPLIDMLAGGQRIRLFAGLDLGRTRPATDADRAWFPLPLPDQGNADLIRPRVDWRAEAPREVAPGTFELVLHGPPGTTTAERWRIDAERGLPIRYERFDAGLRVADESWSEPVQVRGTWFMTRHDQRDADGNVTRREQLTVMASDAAIVVPKLGPFTIPELPDVDDAIDAVAADRATAADHLALIADAISDQRHDEAQRRMAAWNPAPGSLQAVWIDAWLQSKRRDPEAARRAAEALADAVSKVPGPARPAVAVHAEGLLAAHLDPDQRLALHDQLRPAWSFASDPWRAERGEFDWQLSHEELLRAAGRTDERIDLWSRLTAARPKNPRVVLGLEGALWDAGREESALASLRAALDRTDDFRVAERARLHSRLCQRMLQRRDAPGLEAAAGAWIADGATDTSPYLLRSAAIVLQGRADAVDTELDAITADAARLLDPSVADADDRFASRPGAHADRTRVEAAAAFLLGDAEAFSRYRQQRPQEAVRLARLIEAARTIPSARAVASRWFADRRFQGSVAESEFEARLRQMLIGGIGPDTDLDTVRFAIGAVPWNGFPDEIRTGLVDQILARARGVETTPEMRSLVDLAIRVAPGPAAKELKLRVLRERIRSDVHRPWREGDLAALAAALAELDWSADVEAEQLAVAAARIDLLPDGVFRVDTSAWLARQLADQLVTARVKHALGPVEELELLPRRERRARERAAQEEQRAALADVLDGFATSRDGSEALPWRVEAACFATESAQRERARDAAVELWNAAAPLAENADAVGLVRDRAGLVLAHTAAQRGADEAFVDTVVAAVERLAPAGDDGPRRQLSMLLLIAVDRPDALAERVGSWLAAGGVQRQHRELAARLAVEAGRFDLALERLTPLESAPLGPTAAALELKAGCLSALDRDADARPAKLASIDVRPVDELQNHVRQAIRRSSRGPDGAPERLRDVDIHAAVSLAARMPDPTQASWQLRSIWNESRDFRALTPWAAAIHGLTTRQAMPVIDQARRSILQVADEAAFDELATAIDAGVAAADTPRERLHYRLLEALVGRESVNVPSRLATPERMTASLDAIREITGAESLDWLSPQDRRALANFLADLQRLDDRELARTRRVVVDHLVAQAERSSSLRRDLLLARARVLWYDDQPELAIDSLVSLIAERRAGGPLSSGMDDVLGTLLAWWSELSAFATAETLLTDLRDAAEDAQRRRNFELRLDDVHAGAVRTGAATSLGRGTELFAAARARLVDRLRATPPSMLDSVLQRIVGLHHAAKSANIDGHGDSLRNIADERIPGLAARNPLDALNFVRTFANGLAEVTRKRDAIRVATRMCIDQPEWYDTIGRDAFDHFDWNLARWRRDDPQLGDVEPLLLDVVLAGLRRDMREQRSSWDALWDRSGSYFWSAAANRYLAVAEEELERAAPDPSAVVYIATSIHDDLDEHRRAIAALAALDERQPLDRSTRRLYARWLEGVSEWADALAELDELAPGAPLDLDVHLARVRMLGKLGRTDEAQRSIDGLIARATEAGVLNESHHASIADTARQAMLFATAAEQFDLAIRDRARRRGDVPDARISEWQTTRAQILSRLGRHGEAIDAAAAGIVAAGNSDQRRNEARRALRSVFEDLPDLSAWIADYEKKVEATGEDAPIIRRELGAVLKTSRRDLNAALHQFRAALALEPGDRDLLRQVVDLELALGEDARALAALRDAVFAGRDGAIEWTTEYARRLAVAGRAGDSRRAWTQLVEPLPREAEGHVALARHFTDEERFDSAWREWTIATDVRPDVSDHWLGRIEGALRAGEREAAKRAVDAMLERDWGDRTNELRQRATQLLAGY